MMAEGHDDKSFAHPSNGSIVGGAPGSRCSFTAKMSLSGGDGKSVCSSVKESVGNKYGIISNGASEE